MAHFQIPCQRLILAAIVAMAAFIAPAALISTSAAVSPKPLAACTGGEEEDLYTSSCVPLLVPNSPDDSGFTTNAANPDIPEIQGVPCTGHDSGACIGLSEEQQDLGPQPVPRSTIEASP